VTCEITFESWVRCQDESELAGLRLAVSTAVAVLTNVEGLYLDIHPAELHGGYAHVAVLARQDSPLRLGQWGDLHSQLEWVLGIKIAVSKITVWVPYAAYERDSVLVSAEQLIREMGCEPRVWSDWDDEIKIGQRPGGRRPRPSAVTDSAASG